MDVMVIENRPVDIFSKRYPKIGASRRKSMSVDVSLNQRGLNDIQNALSKIE